MEEIKFKRKEIKFLKYFTKTRLLVALFIIVFLGILIYNFTVLQSRRTYYTNVNDQTFPIVYQVRKERKINILRGYKEEKYKDIINDTLFLLEDQRILNLEMYQNGANVKEIEYEIRNKTTNELIERTKVPIQVENTSKIKLIIQNLIEEKTTYALMLKCDVGDKKVYYFANILYKRKTVLDDAIKFVEDFTEYTFDKIKAAEIVKYFETNPNTDQKQMNNVTIESNFDQITWAETKMERMSDYVYEVYQAQDYCFDININYLTKSKEGKDIEYYKVVDEYVVRWDGVRYYIMKFNRKIEEFLNIDNDIFDAGKKRFYLGVTNLDDFQKIESENKKYILFEKNNEVYEYNTEEKTIQNIFGYSVRDEKKFLSSQYKTNTKLLDIDDLGNAHILSYGYNPNGANEGLMGLSVWLYIKETNQTIQNIFVPIYTTYQDLDYDLKKLCLLKNESLYFKSLDKIYSVDIINSNTFELVENIEDTTSEGSFDSLHFAYNAMGEKEKKEITIVNMDDMSREYIEAEEDEEIEVITYMNDDLFYGVRKKGDEWIEANKLIGFPYRKIVSVNSKTKDTKTFEDPGYFYYNLIPSKTALHFNKYTKKETHYFKETNDVVVNNYVPEQDLSIKIGEEMTKRKLRIAYLEIDTGKSEIKKIMQTDMNVRNVEDGMLNEEESVRRDVYYVYNNGNLVGKTKVLSDGIGMIRDSYGYVKMNDKITCYNRSNKANLSYLRKNDEILENIEKFEENICLIDDKILVMNLTGVTCRDLEYYISLGEKLACFKNDIFQFFITGYDNNNYVLEYDNKDRILTPRKEVEETVEYNGYIIFGQLKNLE